MSRALNDLSPECRAMAVELLARLTEARIPVMIIDTLRTREEQQSNIDRGVSWTMNSKHLPDANGQANAIDVAPYLRYDIAGPDMVLWDSKHPIWQKIGEAGEAVGFIWGGRWTVRDMGHFERPMP